MAGYAIIPYYDGPASTQEEMEIAYNFGIDWYTGSISADGSITRIMKTNNLELEVRVAAYSEHGVLPYKSLFVIKSDANTTLKWRQIKKRENNVYSTTTNQAGISVQYNEYYYGRLSWSSSNIDPLIPKYDSLEEALEAMTTPIVKPVSIDYQGINTSFSGPETVDWGEEVSIDVTPGDGMVIQDPAQGKSISVYNENGYIPFVYANGKLTFTVPDAPNP